MGPRRVRAPRRMPCMVSKMDRIRAPERAKNRETPVLKKMKIMRGTISGPKAKHWIFPTFFPVEQNIQMVLNENIFQFELLLVKYSSALSNLIILKIISDNN